MITSRAPTSQDGESDHQEEEGNEEEARGNGAEGGQEEEQEAEATDESQEQATESEGGATEPEGGTATSAKHIVLVFCTKCTISAIVSLMSQKSRIVILGLGKSGKKTLLEGRGFSPRSMNRTEPLL